MTNEGLGPLYLEDLPTRCGTPGCQVRHALQLSSRCHPGPSVRAVLDAGVLAFRCATCDAPIVRIVVARKGAMA